jgi:hypothetical protein
MKKIIFILLIGLISIAGVKNPDRVRWIQLNNGVYDKNYPEDRVLLQDGKFYDFKMRLDCSFQKLNLVGDIILKNTNAGVADNQFRIAAYYGEDINSTPTPSPFMETELQTIADTKTGEFKFNDILFTKKLLNHKDRRKEFVLRVIDKSGKAIKNEGVTVVKSSYIRLRGVE